MYDQWWIYVAEWLEPIFLIVQKLNQICFGKMPKRFTSLARNQDFASVRLNRKIKCFAWKMSHSGSVWKDTTNACLKRGFGGFAVFIKFYIWLF